MEIDDFRLISSSFQVLNLNGEVLENAETGGN